MVACVSAAVWQSTTATSDVSWTSGRSSTRGVLVGGLVTFASRPSLTVCLTTRSLVHATSADISRRATSASKVCKVLELRDAVHLFCRLPDFEELRHPLQISRFRIFHTRLNSFIAIFDTDEIVTSVKCIQRALGDFCVFCFFFCICLLVVILHHAIVLQ